MAIIEANPMDSDRTLAHRLKCSPTTARRKRAAFRKAQTQKKSPLVTPEKEPRNKESAPWVVDRRAITDVILRSAEGKFSTAVDIVYELFTKHRIDVCPNTVRSDLAAMGWLLKNRPRCPAISPENIEARLTFAKRFLDTKLDLAFSDEVMVGCQQYTGTQYCEPGTAPAPMELDHWSPKAHIFGVITRERHRLWRLDCPTGVGGGVTGSDWTAKLGRNMAELKNLLKGKTLVLDGASIHTCKHTRKWLAENSIDVLPDWPPHSPNLNPIENWWSILKRCMHGDRGYGVSRDKKKDDIWAEFKSVAFEQSGKERLSALIDSFRGRLEKCIAEKGGYTGY